eukprot:GGOE01045488.1.p1 GENE.GGOE01045488.1~~GGOE01045488.1.p1  ORF type:complete len:208 (+),score=21.92 GGOE01045488.1:138-761(+)
MAAPVYRTNSALAIDAADGVIDGKYYGRPIIETTGVRAYGGYYPRYTSDCCSPSVSYGTYGTQGYPVRRVYPTSASVTRYERPYSYYDDSGVTYGGAYSSGLNRYYAPTPLVRQASNVAQTLDAADGVIDGRYYGRPIIEAPVRRYAGSSVAERLDAADGVIDGRYFGRPIVEAPARRYVGSSVAERLDASDGVMDGKYFGRKIVQV